MKLTHEQTTIIIDALQDMRANLYINDNMVKMHKVGKIIANIEKEMEPKDLSQKKIMINDNADDIGCETGIERDYASQGKPNCEVCDD